MAQNLKNYQVVYYNGTSNEALNVRAKSINEAKAKAREWLFANRIKGASIVDVLR